MKKTIIISAMALCVSFGSFATSNLNSPNNGLVSVREFKVSPFCVSIAKGDFETVKKLIDLGADIDQKSEGMTPLMYAAKYNRTDILTLLINHGANLKHAELHKATDAQAILEEALKKK